MPHPRPRVIITGLGVVSPNGIGAPAFTDALLCGKSGLSRLTPADADVSILKSSAAAIVRDFDPLSVLEPTEARRVPRIGPPELVGPATEAPRLRAAL